MRAIKIGEMCRIYAPRIEIDVMVVDYYSKGVTVALPDGGECDVPIEYVVGNGE